VFYGGRRAGLCFLAKKFELFPFLAFSSSPTQSHSLKFELLHKNKKEGKMRMKISFAIFIAIFNASRAQTCPKGVNITSGPVSGKPKRKNFERRGEGCPCSYVSNQRCYRQNNVLLGFIPSHGN